MRADDDLILTAGVHDLDDAVGVLENLVVGEGLVLELETQARDTVGEALHVLLATHILDDDAREAIILACHIDSFNSIQQDCYA